MEVEASTGAIRRVRIEFAPIDTGVDPEEDDGYVYHPLHEWTFIGVTTVKNPQECRAPDPPLSGCRSSRDVIRLVRLRSCRACIRRTVRAKRGG